MDKHSSLVDKNDSNMDSLKVHGIYLDKDKSKKLEQLRRPYKQQHIKILNPSQAANNRTDNIISDRLK